MAVRDVIIAAAGLGGAEPLFVESVFSTYLYTGNGSTQTITNGIDLAGEGGLVWLKSRSLAEAHQLFDTERGIYNRIFSNSTNAQSTGTNSLTAFNSDGFSIGDNNISNTSGSTNASWTFRKAQKFFDVVTYTGNGVANRQIAHNLGSTPGCIIIKRTDAAVNWVVYHAALGSGKKLFLNTTSEFSSSSTFPSGGTYNSTIFTIDGSGGDSVVNASGGTYVAYLFAHDAGGFGADGSENVISCGSFTMDGSGDPASITLGYEPQMVIVKRTDSTSNWYIEDNMRGLPVTGNGKQLYANTSGAEAAQNIAYPNATGFTWNIGIPSATYIYIAIRRPMKPPSVGTEVFSPIATTASGNTKITTDFSLDFQIQAYRTAATPNNSKVMTRLTGVNTSPVNTVLPYMITASTAAEVSDGYTRYWDNTGFEVSSGLGGGDSVYWNFRRAPGFMDVVCYTGTGSATTVNHNLTVAPEMMIVKARTGTRAWRVFPNSATQFLTLNSTGAIATDSTMWNNTAPTTSVFSVGTADSVNGSTVPFVAYLFASLPGISKVGSYTGTGTTKQVNCGFTSGARFVLIKRTDSTGGWYVWDSARGIVAGNDPYLLLNSTNAEVTSTDYVDTYSAGFEISSTAPAAINANGGSFIFFAVA